MSLTGRNFGRARQPGAIARMRSSDGPAPRVGNGPTAGIRPAAGTDTTRRLRPVPGTADHGTHVTFLPFLRRALPATNPGSLRPHSASRDAAEVEPDSLLAVAATSQADATAAGPVPAEAAQAPARRPFLRRRGVQVALGAVVLALVGGSVAVAKAHKSVTLDVDGRITHLSTFAGSVAGLLEEEDVVVGRRDLVAPDADAALRSGDDIVVRHAHQVRVLADGQERTVWTTALDAGEALTALADRGSDVRLVASRSGGERPALAISLGAGPVDVRVDGTTLHAARAADLDALFAGLDITVGALDRVHVERPDAGQLTVVVQRVVVNEEAVTSAIPFETVVEQAADLYQGTTRTATAGAPGELAVRYRVTLVDGVEESRVELRRDITRQPVTAIVREGTKVRPVRTAPAAAPAATVSVGDDVWGALARCESGGNPAAVSGNGKYYGLYQFSVGTWQAMGGSGLPSEASAAEQLQRAQALQARSGWGQWPACAAKLGLL